MQALAMPPSKRAIHASAPRRSALPPGYKEDSNAPAMLRYEESLPRLPVPPLAQTCERYLDSVRPHLSEAEFSKTTTAVQSFMTSPLASELQKRLEARASQPEMISWLSEWWNDAAYMAYRDPVVVFVSYFYLHLDDRGVRTQPKRAAQLVKAMLPFRALVDSYVTHPCLIRECRGSSNACSGESSSQRKSRLPR
jgi:carnitine O-acetyltransferase